MVVTGDVHLRGVGPGHMATLETMAARALSWCPRAFAQALSAERLVTSNLGGLCALSTKPNDPGTPVPRLMQVCGHQQVSGCGWHGALPGLPPVRVRGWASSLSLGFFSFTIMYVDINIFLFIFLLYIELTGSSRYL